MIDVMRVSKTRYAEMCFLARSSATIIRGLSETYADQIVSGEDTRETERNISVFRDVLGTLRRELQPYQAQSREAA